MIGARSKMALVGMIFEKQLKMYPSSLSEFSSGEIINFVQVDADRLY